VSRKRRLTAAEKRAKKERRKKYMWIFVNGKQKRVKRPELIEGLDPHEFIRRNADPVWLVQSEMWELLYEYEQERDRALYQEEDTIVEGLIPGDERVEPEIIEAEFIVDGGR
jgi:hypothetical protein